MEDQDKEFETFLAQFELRQHRPLLEESPTIPRRVRTSWILAVAALLVAAVVSIPWIRNFSRDALPVAIVEVVGDSAYKAGQEIVFGTPIHSGGFESAALKLKDGTLIEMRAQSELQLESAKDGVRIRLSNGSVLVTAATQKTGRLYVETQDSVVSVVGTVFFVEKTQLGTRVGVCEGEVEVQDTRLRRLLRLLPGQQTSTNPSMEGPLVEAIAWSSSAPRWSALLQPSIGSPALSHTPQETPEPQQPPPSPLPPSPPSPPPPAQEQPTPDAPPAPPPPDKGAGDTGKDILNKACGACHVVGLVETTRYGTREAYTSLISRQKAYGAAISDGEVPVLVDYLFRTYGTMPSK